MSFFTVRAIGSAVAQLARKRSSTSLYGGLLSISSTGQLSAVCPLNVRSMFSAWHRSVFGCCTTNTRLHIGWKKSSISQLHTSGDQELADFLKDEIKLEKDQQKKSGKLPKLKGFEITKTEGPTVELTKKLENETVTIKFNVNNSVEDSTTAMEGEKQNEEEGGAQMVSRPAFVVEIHKGGDKTLAIHCVYPQLDDIPPPSEHDQHEQYDDLIEIQDVTILNKSQEWTDDAYSLSGSVMDGNLYDMLLKLLEERGVDADFIEQLIDFSTSYEHKKYVELLEQFKAFVDSK